MNEEKRQGLPPDSAGRSLRDLFDAARKDARPTLLERRDAEDLIRNSETTVLHRLDFRHGWVRRNLLSSPIRIGVTLMTTSAFASLMAIAVSQFTGSPSTPVEKPATHPPILYSQPAPSQHADTRIESVPTQAIAVRPNSEPSKPPQLPVNFSTAKAADSDTLHAVELNPDQLARLGIELSDSGDILVYHRNSRGQIRCERFSPKGYMSQVTPPPGGSTQIGTLPFAITYPMGEALLYSKFIRPGASKPDILAGMSPAVARKYQQIYAERRGEAPTDQTSFGVSMDVSDDRNDGHTRTKVIAEVRTNCPANGPTLTVQPGSPQLPPAGPAHNVPSTNAAGPMIIVEPENGTTGVVVRPPAPGAVSGVSRPTSWSPSAASPNISLVVSDSINEDGTGNGVDVTVHGMSNQDDGNLEIGGLRQHVIVKSLIIDSTMKFSELPGWFKPNDSIGSMVKHFATRVFRSDSVSVLRGNMSSVDLKSLMSDSLGLRKLLNGVQCDSLMKSLGQVGVGIAINKTSNAASGQGQSLETYYRRESGDTTSWSSLIPVRVTNYNTPEHHTLIFWYERTPEVMNIVPRSAVEKADARPKNLELSVYPNPTSGVTNIHYVVKNGEPVTINVVSLLGQKLIEGGSRLDQHGDLSLDLSSLEPGVYLLIATLQSGEKAVERVVVTK